MSKKIDECLEPRLQEYEFTKPEPLADRVHASVGMTDYSEPVQPGATPNPGKTVH